MATNKFALGLIIVAVLLAAAVVVYAVVVYTRDSGASADQNSVANSTGTRATSTLKFVVVVSRHGNRSPLSSYSTCPYNQNNRTVWPFGVGQLTKRGRVQMYNLGAKLRSLYNGFLNEIYYPEDFRASSTLMNRTMMSAAQMLAGLFPPKDFEVWSNEIPWQPIPILPNYLDHNSLVGSPQSCPAFAQARNASRTAFYNKYGANMTAIAEQLQPYTGWTVSPGSVSNQLASVWEPLICADFEGLPLPSWAPDVYPEPLGAITAEDFRSLSVYSDTMTRLFQGLLFQEIVNSMQAKINGTMARNMYYYSGHDFTIVGLQAILALAASDLGIVHAGSALIFELHQYLLTENFYVQVLYIDGGSSDLEPKLIQIPGCGSPCDFTTLTNITEKYYNITDFTTECQQTS